MINLGFFTIHIYSICLIIGIFFGYYFTLKESINHGFDKEEISDFIFNGIIFGIIGARLYYCIFNYDYYFPKILNIFKVWEGGLAIHGGIFAGGIYIIYYCHKKKYNLLKILDYVVLGLILAQAIGRWGNFFNGEAHGPATSLNFLKSLFLPKFIIDGMYVNGTYYIPTFLYESLWCLFGFILMYFFRNSSKNKVGYLTGFYAIWYGAERFCVESLRTDSLMFFSFKMAQIVSILMLIFGAFIFVYSYRKSISYKEE